MVPMSLRAFVVAAFLAVAPVGVSAASPQVDLGAITGTITRQLERLERELLLTPPQKDQYVAAVTATKRLVLQMTMAGMQAKARIEEELAKPRPDLNVLWELRETLVDDSKTLRRETKEEWAKLYAMLDADQVATLKRFIDERMNNLGLLHDFFLQLVLTPPKERI